VASLFSHKLKRLFSYVRPLTLSRLGVALFLLAFVAIAEWLVAFHGAPSAWDYVFDPTAPALSFRLFTVRRPHAFNLKSIFRRPAFHHVWAIFKVLALAVIFCLQGQSRNTFGVTEIRT